MIISFIIWVIFIWWSSTVADKLYVGEPSFRKIIKSSIVLFLISTSPWTKSFNIVVPSILLLNLITGFIPSGALVSLLSSPFFYHICMEFFLSLLFFLFFYFITAEQYLYALPFLSNLFATLIWSFIFFDWMYSSPSCWIPSHFKWFYNLIFIFIFRSLFISIFNS